MGKVRQCNNRPRLRRVFSLLFLFGLPDTLCAADDGILEHYITVDLGTKYYNFLLTEKDGSEREEFGVFRSNVVISPTVRALVGNNKGGLLIAAGLSFSHHGADDITVDGYEWQLGLGAFGKLTEWAHINLMLSGGYGITGVHLPANWPTIQGDHTDWGLSGHGEITVGVTCAIDHIAFMAQVGYRISQLNIDDQKLDRSADYTIHGAVFSLGLGLSY